MPDLSELLTKHAETLVVGPVAFEGLERAAARRRRRARVFAASGAALAVAAVAVLTSTPVLTRRAQPADRSPACDLHARNPAMTVPFVDRPEPLSDAEAITAARRGWSRFGLGLERPDSRPQLQGLTPRVLRLPYKKVVVDYQQGGVAGETVAPAPNRCTVVVTFLVRGPRGPATYTSMFDAASGRPSTEIGSNVGFVAVPVPNREQVRRILTAVDRLALTRHATASHVTLVAGVRTAFTLPEQHGPWLSAFGSWVARVDLVGATHESVDVILDGSSLRVLEQRPVAQGSFPPYLGRRYVLRPQFDVVYDAPMGTSSCTTADLKGRIKQASLRGSERAYLVGFVNGGTTACQLAAQPLRLTGVDAHGDPVTVGLEPWDGNQDSRNRPAPAAPGEAEHLILLTLDATCPAPAVRLSHLRFGFLDGSVAVPGDLVVCRQLVLVSPPAGPDAVLGGI